MKTHPVLQTCLILALAAIAMPARAEVSPFDRARAEAHCAAEWTKRGTLDRDMYAYCMDRQTEGYQEALQLRAENAAMEDIDDIVRFAEDKWLDGRDYQFEMVAYEIEGQVDAFLNIAYDMKAGKYSEAQVMACLMEWYSAAEPQWDMVEYCLRD